jgi:AMP-binding enzyme
MTIAFDFSVEEIWVPLLAGATLVPKPAGSSLLGDELREFLAANEVTVLCCVPTLLATLDQDLPGLRFLLVSGEACRRTSSLGGTGPTEATVTATWTVVHPDRPVTIGVPLPTYSAVILDPTGEHQALLPGEVGEIGIAGIGLARGYLNRDDLTDRAFIPDFVGIDNNPSSRIYRTGDLGRVNDDGEIEYHGRIDTQVKIRGYRVELPEIESVLLQVPESRRLSSTPTSRSPARWSWSPTTAGAPTPSPWTSNRSTSSCAGGSRGTWCRPTSRSSRSSRCSQATRPTAATFPRRAAGAPPPRSTRTSLRPLGPSGSSLTRWPVCCAGSRCRSRATSSTVWAPTHCSWRSSAHGSASVRTYRRCP